jgi:hypothetical protein
MLATAKVWRRLKAAKGDTMSINELFGTNESTTTNARSLAGTAELTNIATATAHRIIKAMEADIETYRPRIQQSALDAKELDAIINEFKPLHEIDEDHMLRALSDEVVEGMLKSQQSKRSRAKSKAMTIDNYTTLLTAAIAEDILREIYNKPKSAGGFHRAAGSVDYTVEQLQALHDDQIALRKEIRNIQSKKSIMKSKADFSEEDPRWLALLRAEQQLKDMRIGGASTQVVEVDKTKNALTEMLGGVDVNKLKSAEAHELLERIAQMAAGNVAEEETTDEETAEEIQ